MARKPQDKQINFTSDADLYARVIAAAREADQSMGAWCRTALRAQLRRQRVTLPAAVGESAGVSSSSVGDDGE